MACCYIIVWADVQQIATPTLILCGAEDLATPPDLAQQMAATMSNATCRIIQNAAHLPCIEQPAVMVAEIERFLKGYV